MIAWLAGAAVAAGVDSARLEHDVRALVGVDAITVDGEAVELVSRNIHHPHNRLAGEWIHDRFGEIDGLDVRREKFRAEGEDGLFNVVADLPGTDPDAEWVILGAHYDSTASFTDGWDPATDPAPGADDDASGVSAVLELARILSAERFERSIRFVAFTAEEEGLLGSAEHVDGLDLPGVRLMVSLDPVGYNPASAHVLWATFDARWPSDGLALETFGENSPLEVTAVDAAAIGGDQRSDHAPFWNAGYPALHLASFPQPVTYHTVDDTLDGVDFDFLRDVTALVGEHVRDIAVPDPVPVTPDDDDKGCAYVPFERVSLLILGLVVVMTRRRAC